MKIIVYLFLWRRYSRSKSPNKIWLFAHLFVPLPRSIFATNGNLYPKCGHIIVGFSGRVQVYHVGGLSNQTKLRSPFFIHLNNNKKNNEEICIFHVGSNAADIV